MISNLVLKQLHVFSVNVWFPSDYGYFDYEQVDNVICTGDESTLRDCFYDVIQVDSDSTVEIYCDGEC